MTSVNSEDKFQILDLISNYGYSSDRRDIESFLELFTDDVIIEFFSPDQKTPRSTYSNKKGVRKWCEELENQHEQSKQKRQYRHFQTNTVLTQVSDDCVKGQTYFFVSVQHEERTKPEMILSGIYKDEFQRTPSGGKFSYRGVYL